MNATLIKTEPIWYEVVTPDGKKTRIRKLKHSLITDIADFPDALSYDGASMKLFKPEQYAESGLVVQVRREALQMAKILIEEALRQICEKEKEAQEYDG